MKKVTLSLLALGFLAVPVAHADFPDVPAAHPNYQAISALEDLKVVQGFPNGEFKPDEKVDRSQFLKMAYLAEAKPNLERRAWEAPTLFPFGKEADIKIDPPCFGDLKGTEWFEPYVCWGKERGLVSGDGKDGLFHPLRGVNFAEASKILIETSGQPGVRTGSHWAEGYIELLKGMIPTSIQTADQLLTRADAAQLIYNYTLASDQTLEAQPSNVLIWDNGGYLTLDYIGLVLQGFDERLHYMSDGQKVFMVSENYPVLQEVKDADVASFKLVPFVNSLLIPLDDHALYEGAQKIEGSGGGSFHKVGESFDSSPGSGFFGMDDEKVYLISCWEGCQISRILPDSEVSTFTALEEGYAKDAHQAYFLDHVLLEVEPGTFQTLKPSEENLFCQLPFAKDEDTVFLREMPLLEMEAASFEFLDPSGFFFKDKTHIYRAGLEGKGYPCDSNLHTLIPEADLLTFEAFGTNHFGSKGKIYYVTRSNQVSQIPEADYETFQPLYSSLSSVHAEDNIDVAKDQNHAYYWGKVLVGIDATTFTYDESLKQWKDKNGSYGWQALWDKSH